MEWEKIRIRKSDIDFDLDLIEYEDAQDFVVVEVRKKVSKNCVKEVIDYLNEIANTKYRHSTASTTKAVNARLQEGYTVNDMKGVIWCKAQDTFFIQNKKYLSPGTLFRPGNFEKYYNEWLEMSAQLSNKGEYHQVVAEDSGVSF